MWWMLDRHHGLGNLATTASASEDARDSASSGDSHRRRRLLAVHSKQHF